MKLIRTFQDLCKALEEAIYESCYSCQQGEVTDECPQKDGSCFVQKWRKTLKQAKSEIVIEKKLTKGDKFRAMTDAKIAEYMSVNHMCDYCPAETKECNEAEHRANVCVKVWKRYLKQEAK